MATAFHALSGPFSATVAAWAKGSPNRKDWTEAEANRMGFVLDIPFRCKAAKEIRDLAKLCGARFDGGTKSWSVAYSALTPLKLNTLNCLGIIKAAIPARVAGYCPRDIGLRYIVLGVGFDQKDRAKAAGAQWNSLCKYWYMTVQTTPAFSDALKAFEADGLVDHVKTNDLAIKCGSISQPYSPQSLGAPLKPFSAPQGQELFRQAPLRRFRHTPKGKPVAATPKPVVSAPAGNQQTPGTSFTQNHPVDQSTVALCDYLKGVIGGTIPDSKWTVRTIWRSGNKNTWAVKHWCFNPQCPFVVCLDRFVQRPAERLGNFRNIDSRPWVPADRNVLVHDIFVYSKEDARTAWNAHLNTQIPEAKWFPLLHPPRIGVADSGVGELGLLASDPQGNGSPSATFEMTSLDLFMSIYSQGSLFENVRSRGEIAQILSILTDRQSGQRNKWMGVAY